MQTNESEIPLSGDEVVAICDEKGEVIGSRKRSEVRSLNLIHQASFIFIENSKGQLYVQKRTMLKDYLPGYYDPCTGGVVKAGEDLKESALRELEEEMGIDTKEVPFQYVCRFFFQDSRTRCWGDIWATKYDGQLKLQPEEVELVIMETPNEILENVKKGKKYTDDGLYALQKYIEWKEKNK